ncbi:hypothetical protein PRUPE_5G161800 [Prunus persica]|uniref:Uncharacterized protein n=1 Tax=Prunus persica TaxID=3760 RepID=A0A251P9B8_PRUPE|nr:hypothetical protein PRUPE_5G161800 [Prunus persica]
MDVLDLPLCASAQGLKALNKGSGNHLLELIIWQVTHTSIVQGDARCTMCCRGVSNGGWGISNGG